MTMPTADMPVAACAVTGVILARPPPTDAAAVSTPASCALARCVGGIAKRGKLRLAIACAGNDFDGKGSKVGNRRLLYGYCAWAPVTMLKLFVNVQPIIDPG
jgi:hypothetical protein